MHIIIYKPVDAYISVVCEHIQDVMFSGYNENIMALKAEVLFN